jgi:hypothetical protein
MAISVSNLLMGGSAQQLAWKLIYLQMDVEQSLDTLYCGQSHYKDLGLR